MHTLDPEICVSSNGGSGSVVSTFRLVGYLCMVGSRNFQYGGHPIVAIFGGPYGATNFTLKKLNLPKNRGRRGRAPPKSVYGYIDMYV